MSQSTQTKDQMNPNESLVLTVGEAAKLLRLSKTTTYDQIRQGSIPSIRIGKRILVPRAALMHMLEETIGKAG
ncbi:helix-turn-helix domain-containing protein [Chloroflexota bacterium]